MANTSDEIRTIAISITVKATGQTRSAQVTKPLNVMVHHGELTDEGVEAVDAIIGKLTSEIDTNSAQPPLPGIKTSEAQA